MPPQKDDRMGEAAHCQTPLPSEVEFYRGWGEDAGLQRGLALPVPGRALPGASAGQVYGREGLLWCVRPRLVQGGV